MARHRRGTVKGYMVYGSLCTHGSHRRDGMDVNVSLMIYGDHDPDELCNAVLNAAGQEIFRVIRVERGRYYPGIHFYAWDDADDRNFTEREAHGAIGRYVDMRWFQDAN